MHGNKLKFLALFLIISFNSKLFSIDINSIPKTKEIWTDFTAQLYHDYFLMEAFRPINQGLCQTNNSDYGNWVNLNTLADPVTKEMPTSYDPNNSSEDIFNVGYKSNINDRNCGVFEDNFFNVIKSSQASDDSPLIVESFKERQSISDSRFKIEITEDVSSGNPYGVMKYDLNIYGLLRGNGLYLAHVESKYDETGNNVIIDSITWVDAIIINPNLNPGDISESYRARINHVVGGNGYGTIIGMQQGGFDTVVNVPVPHGSFPDGIPDIFTKTDFAYNDESILFKTETVQNPGSPYTSSNTGELGLACIDRTNFWTYVPLFGYGVYDSNGDRISDGNISVFVDNVSVQIVDSANVSIPQVCTNMNDGSEVSISFCADDPRNYQGIPVIDIQDGTVVTDTNGNEYYIRVLKPRKVYKYKDLSDCSDIALQDSIDTPDHKTFTYLNEVNIPPSGGILYNQFSSGDTIDVQYLGKVYVANADDDGDGVLNFLDAFPDDATKSVDDDYDGIDDSEDSDIAQRVMTWNKYLDKDIFELPDNTTAN